MKAMFLSSDAPLVFELQVLKYYTQSIRLGHRHIYKSLPRLLTLWCAPLLLSLA